MEMSLSIFKTSKDTNSIPDNFVQSLFEDSKGNIWIGTYGEGLAVYDPTKNTFKRINSKKSNLSDDIIMCIAEHNEKIYIGTKRRGLNLLDLETNDISQVVLNDTSSKIQIRDILVSENKIFAATSSGGVHIYENNAWNQILDTVQFQCIEQAGENIFVGSLNGDVFSINHSESYLISTKALENKEVWGITNDQNDNLWIGTFGDGLIEYNQNSNKVNRNVKSKTEDINSLSHDVILTIFKDRNGGIWIGTLGGGINYFEPDNIRFKHYSEFNGLSNNVVMSFLENGEDLYIGTFGGGLNKFNLNSKEFTTINEVQGQIIRCIHKQNDEQFWIGTYGNGLIKYNPKTGESQQILPNVIDDVWCIKEGSNNSLWLGTWGSGLINYNINNNTFKQYTKSNRNSISENTILSIEKDEKGNLYLGTYGSGLNYFDLNKNHFIHFNFEGDSTGTNNKKIRSLLMDSKKLWIGTDGGGLNVYDITTNNFTYYTTDNGLPNNVIYDIEEKDDTWLTTNYGISKFDKINKTFRNYNYDDGLQNNEFNQGALHKGENNFYAGGIEGFNIFNPTDFNIEISFSNTIISSMKISDEEYPTPIQYLDSINLYYDDNFLSFQFSNLDFSGKSKYRCKLNGFDDDWIYLEERNFINYTNLPPGNYTLEYQGERTGLWKREPKTLFISIPPPFWETYWFYFLLLLAILLIIYFYIKLKEKNLLVRNLELENQVKVRTRLIDLKNKDLEGKNKDITDSINYAKNIQDSILPTKSFLKQHLPNHFIFYEPKDIVSGDFYWCQKVGDEVIFAVVDCTGHGVPGAFMSIIGSNGLQKAVIGEKLTQPSLILDSLNCYIKDSIQQEDGYIRDGMDIAICNLNLKTKKLKYAGAFNSLILIQNNELNELKSDRFIIGSTNKKYTNHEINLEKNTCFYIYTDGFADQFGGPRNKKFNFPKFRKLLLDVRQKSMSDQHDEIKRSFDKWKGKNEQIDDVCIMGVKI